MDIAVIGAGEVGYHLADILSREDHRVSVIDADPAKARRLMEALDVQVVVGDGSRADVLNNAGVSKADLVVAVTDRDRANMMTCMVAKRLGAKRVILRLHDTALLADYRYFYKQALGFDIVISTEDLAAEEIVNTLRERHALEVESFADGRVQVRRLRLPAESSYIGKPISDLDLPGGLVIGAVSRGEEFFIPKGSALLEGSDQVYVVGRRSALDAFEVRAGAPTVGRRGVVIMGGGALGREVSRRLAGVPGVSIRIIERDPARARALAADRASDVMVLEGDATDLDLLHEERIGEADVFVATSGDDERNIVACQLARSLGAKRTMTMVNKPSYNQIYDLLGIDKAISPRILCANRILRFVRSGSVSAIAVLGDGKAEVLELEARLGGKKGGRKVKSLDLPSGAVIGALVRGNEVTIPHGESVIEDGDHVIVISLPDKVQRVCGVFKRPDEG
ncbi:MAG: Trk system potassium transporter TrkA [Planctomycetota bacterium]|jgi:trk system potassium uptake protein TrkA|nr:Trk system potassium transporter TrkA [Planctomycetota bacterium]MDP6762145.1 Trk system potassium transporter TrkA [Planctomycetota bacterium]MDP6990605.1 Trk system potassium transporter TrkA [Planctomycetota bacterium]